MKKNVFLSLSLSFFVAFFAISFVSAQTEEPVLTDNNVGETSDNSGDLETVDDILVELEEPEELEGGIREYYKSTKWVWYVVA